MNGIQIIRFILAGRGIDSGSINDERLRYIYDKVKYSSFENITDSIMDVYHEDLDATPLTGRGFQLYVSESSEAETTPESVQLTQSTHLGWQYLISSSSYISTEFSGKVANILNDVVQSYLNQDSFSRHFNELDELVSKDYEYPVADTHKRIRETLHHILCGAMQAAYRKILDTAAFHGIPAAILDSSIRISLLKPFEFGTFIGTFTVGNDALIIYARGKKIIRLHSEETFAAFLTDPDFFRDPIRLASGIRFETTEHPDTIVWLSDHYIRRYGDKFLTAESDGEVKQYIDEFSYTGEILGIHKEGAKGKIAFIQPESVQSALSHVSQ